MSNGEFVHLHVHSEYSLLDGLCPVEGLAARAAELGFRSLALTDHGVLFGAIPFYNACRRAGIKPILGCEISVGEPSRHLILLAQDYAGYQNLMRIVSQGLSADAGNGSAVELDTLARFPQGLICLTGCRQGPLAAALAARQPDTARFWAAALRDIFGRRLYVELQDQGLPEQPELNGQLAALAQGLTLPLAATNNVHYLRQSDSRLHNLLLAIGLGRPVKATDKIQFTTTEFYLKSGPEMAATFREFPAALRNTVAIADEIDIRLPLGQLHLPEYALPPNFADADSYLRELCRQGLSRRYAGRPPIEADARLGYELDVIRRMGYAGYFLIVWDFVDFAHRRSIPVGPGRGSGAGSFVAYLLGITGVDPLAHGLLFERFLNPERVDLPDFDIDFCYERRGEVIDYVTQKYGADRVAQIITFGTLASRAAVRDVGRALGLPHNTVDQVAKSIPPGMDLATALAGEPRLKALQGGGAGRAVAELLDWARQLEGCPRHISTHAAGVIITPTPLTDHVPLCRSGSTVLTQYSMNHLKTVGLLKMDFLGLRMLTVIDQAAADIRRLSPDFEPADIPLNDAAVFRLLAGGHTSGLFQLEADWVADVLRQMRPTQFSDIVAAISLCRPGPMQYIPEYLAAKARGARFRHPDLAPILQNTHGIMVYQEQIMQVAGQIAGFSLGQADLLRRAVGKKDREQLESYRHNFIDGAAARGYSPQLATELWQDIMRFADYGFNQAHATAYGLLAYQTAYLKCHFPAEFMAALMSNAMDMEPKLTAYISECHRLGIRILPVDINFSGSNFTVSKAPPGVRSGLATVKHVGKAAAAVILAARMQGGPFRSMEDLLSRVDCRRLTRQGAEALIQAGALGALGEGRSAMLGRLDAAWTAALRRQELADRGQATLFDFEPKARPILYLRMELAGPSEPLFLAVLAVLKTYPGYSPVRIKFTKTGRWLQAAPEYYVTVTPRLLLELAAIMGTDAVATRPAVGMDRTTAP